MKVRFYIGLICLLGLLMASVGCGGGGSSSSGGGGGGGGGGGPVAAKFSIFWATRSDRSANAPSSARSAKLTIKHGNTDGTDFTYTVNRHADNASYLESYTTPSAVNSGPSDVTLEFFSNADAAGELVAVGSSSVSIGSDGFGIGDVTTIGSITTVQVVPNQVVVIGIPTNLGFTARNQQGQLIAVSPGSAFWSAVEGGNLVSFTGTQATGLARGTASVVVTVDGKASEKQSVFVGHAAKITPIVTAGFSGMTQPSFGRVTAISGDGKVAYGVAVVAAGFRPYRWTAATGMTVLSPIAGFESFSPRACNQDGSVAVGDFVGADGTQHAVRFRQGAGFTVLPTIDGPTTDTSFARGVSDDGTIIVGGCDSAIGPQAFRYTQSTNATIGLGDFSTPDDGASNSFASGVSGDGKVVIGQARLFDFQTRGFMWSAATGMKEVGAVLYPDGPDRFVMPMCVNSDGKAIMGLEDETPFRWTPLSLSSVVQGAALAPKFMSADGNAVLGTVTNSGVVLWNEANGAQDLEVLIAQLGLTAQLAGYRLADASGISADGSALVVVGVSADGNTVGGFHIQLP